MKNMFLSAANYLGKELNLTADDREVVVYGLEVVLSNFITLLIAFWAGMLFGILWEILTASFVWFIIRQFAGGAHCSTLWRCALASSLILVSTGSGAVKLAAVLGQDLIIVLIICTFLTLIPTAIWAPARNPNKPVNSETRRKRFRFMAMLAETVLNLSFLTLVLTGSRLSLAIAGCLAMGTAGFMLTPAGYKTIAVVDRLFGLLFAIIKKGGITR